MPTLLQSARSVWRQSSHGIFAISSGVGVAICTERVEAKADAVWKGQIVACCNLHGACGGKGCRHCHGRQTRCCNLHGACGGKACSTANSMASITLQSARSVWRQRSVLLINLIGCFCCNLHGACGGKDEVRSAGGKAGGVAICTERVEAKNHEQQYRITLVGVAICTERVEAKLESVYTPTLTASLQSARSVWRQRPYSSTL